MDELRPRQNLELEDFQPGQPLHEKRINDDFENECMVKKMQTVC